MKSIDRLRIAALEAGRPPPKLSLSEWADRYYYLSAETSAEPGKWRTLPFQRGIMDAITDPNVEQISLMKSARIGYTLGCVCATIGYYIHQDPTSILVAQPTVDDAKGFSKESIAPMLRDVPVLTKILLEDEKGPKDSSATILHKTFPGGILSLVGSNSGTGFRRVSRRIVIFDEVDAYPPSAGSEGDPIRLGIMRTQAFWNRKIIAGSTPLLAKESRIEELFESGDQRKYYVPCLTCGHMDFLAFREGEAGHWMQWPEGKPEEACFICRECGGIIEHKDKKELIERGEWRTHAPFKGHASFHIWAAYSYSPNATWAHIAKEFIAANKEGPRALQTFVNTVLGETWAERGEAPDWLRLYQRRENYDSGIVPAPVKILTCGVDVQRDRLVWEVVGWGEDKQNWSIDAGVIPGNTADDATWSELDKLISRQFPRENSVELISISVTAVDSGDQTQQVYNWVRLHSPARVIAVKGVATARTILGAPSAVNISLRGKMISRGGKVWPAGSSIAKSELYGWLKLESPIDGKGFPPGFCHFPSGYGEEYFKQLTAEHLVPIVKRTGFTKHEWQVLPGRQNHWLDCRIYARVAATLCGMDRWIYQPKSMERSSAPEEIEGKLSENKEKINSIASKESKKELILPQKEQIIQPKMQEISQSKPKQQKSNWLGGGNNGRFNAKKGWLR